MKSWWEFGPIFLRQQATWWIEMEILAAGNFIKEELLCSLFPDFCQTQKNGFVSSFQLSVVLCLFSATFKSAAYFGICFSWTHNCILLLCQKHLPFFFLLHNFHCYKFMCPAQSHVTTGLEKSTLYRKQLYTENISLKTINNDIVM